MAEPKPILSSAITSEQQDTAGLLRDLVGNVFTDRFLDFCRLINGDARKDMQLRATLPLAAHAMRELESTLRVTLRGPFGQDGRTTEALKAEADNLKAARKALRDLKLFPPDRIDNAVKELRAPKHTDEVTRICVNLGMPADGDTANIWLSLVKRQHSLTHTRSFHVAPVVDDAFRREFGRPFQTLLRDLALAFRRNYQGFVQHVEELASQEDRLDAVRKFKTEVSGALTLQNHFYQKIEGPEWLVI